MIFQLTPDTEAPAEMHMFYPGLRALNLAENATHNLHNIYPIRGAQVRDANAWAKYLNEARDQFAPKADVVFAQHHWPVWGNARLLDYLAKQRDAYKYLHDQTLRLMNHGLKAAEIAERWRCRGASSRSGTCAATTAPSATTPSRSTSAISAGTTPTRPTSIRCRPWSVRGRPWPTWAAPRPRSARAREDFAKGEYRWVADVMSQVVFAEPDNRAARELVRRRAGAAGLPGGVGHLAQRLPARRPRAARRHVGAGRPVARGRRHRARAVARPVLRFPRRAPQRREGRRQDHRRQLGVPRYRRALCADPAELRADLSGRPPRAASPTAPSRSTAPRSTASSCASWRCPRRWARVS